MTESSADSPIWIKLRASRDERARWQALAAARGMSLSELIRSRLDGTRLRARREPPAVAPDLLRELARIGNNLNQLARAANRREPVTATAMLARLIEIDRELAALRAAHQRQDVALAGNDSGGGNGAEGR